jgi:hypothetical protein
MTTSASLCARTLHLVLPTFPFHDKFLPVASTPLGPIHSPCWEHLFLLYGTNLFDFLEEVSDIKRLHLFLEHHVGFPS